MGGPLRIVLAGVLVALPAACSLVVDTSDLAGDAEQADGAREASGVVDGPSAADAHVLDGGADGADGARPCTDSPTRFCDDFDHPGSKWSEYTNRGVLSVAGNGLSLPNALSARVVAGGTDGAASLGKDFDGNPTHVRCELDAKLDAIPSTGEVDLIDLGVAIPGAETHHFYFASFDGVWSVGEFRDASDAGARIDRAQAIGGPLPISVWMHVVFDLSPSALTITANGRAMTLADLTVPLGASRRRMNVGITFASSNVQAAGATIDNVDCTLAP